MIYFIGQNIHLTSLALHEKWWNSAMTGYLAWLAAGGFHVPVVAEEVKPVPSSPKQPALPSASKARTKSKAAKEAPSKLLETATIPETSQSEA